AVFHVPVDIGIRDAAGQRSVRVVLDRRRQIFEIPAPEKPAFVRFDVHSSIPKRLEERKPIGEWLSIAKDDEDVDGRRVAVSVLARILAKSTAGEADPAPLAALVDRLERGSSPAVRAGAAAGVAGVRDSDARTAPLATG